ncbi:MAG TPA: response regulator [Opitutaceae bacterium]
MSSEPSILIVEDNEDDFFILKRAFSSAGVKPTLRQVTDGEEAIHYLSGVGKYSDRVAFPLPLLVLLDLKLPKIPGHDVLGWIRQRPELSGLVVIVLSSSKETSDIEKAYRLGTNAYMVKPSALNELVDAIKALQIFWLRYNIFLPQPAASN